MKAKKKTAAVATPDLDQQNLLAAVGGIEDANDALGKHKGTVRRGIEGLHRALDAEKEAHSETAEEWANTCAALEEKSAADLQREKNAHAETKLRLESEIKLLTGKLGARESKLRQLQVMANDGLESMKGYKGIE